MRSSILLLPFFACVFTLFTACSGKEDKAAVASRAGGAGGNLFGDFGTGGGGGGAANVGDSAVGPNGCPVSPDSTGCVGETFRGETIPLDIYVMFDQSGSMLSDEGGVTRMDAVRTAVGEFLQDSKSTGLGVGIGYFGQQPLGETSCDPAAYEQADVPIGILPGNASAIIDSLAQRIPTGETPSGAAIIGACRYAKQWKADHSSHETVMLLVTDGEPKAPLTCGDLGTGPCCPTLDAAVTAATDCLSGTPGVKTYVLGVGPFLDNLGQIAQAAGTKQAYLVSGGDVSKQVLAALNAIRISAQIPCELQLPPPPPGKQLDYDLVNIVYTTDACTGATLQYRETEATCDAATGGWYYDNPVTPQKVHLCGKSCDDVSGPGGQLLFSVGCNRPPIR